MMGGGGRESLGGEGFGVCLVLETDTEVTICKINICMFT